MSSSNDTPMTRFLYAILEQKCLKDIDWNKVAHNPILTQDITNGHAARMRYSRFKASILGIEPLKRNRTATSKNRVTKSKKDGKIKKTRDSDSVKDDPDSQEPGTQETTKLESPRVKHEMSQPPQDPAMLNSVFNPTSAPMSAADMQAQFQLRLLTPCSDSDALAASSSYGASPGSDMLHADASYDFAGSSPCAHGHEQLSWPHAHPYPAFGVGYELNGYSAGPCDHQSGVTGSQLYLHQHTHMGGQEFGVHQHSQLANQGLQVTENLTRRDGKNAVVKHEAWDDTEL